jgi:hypothetical protein
MVCGSNKNTSSLSSLSRRRQDRQQHRSLATPFMIAVLLLSLLLPTSVFSLDSLTLSTTTTMLSSSSSTSYKAVAAARMMIVRIPRHVWRPAALQHQDCVRQLLEPSLLPRQEYQNLQHRQGPGHGRRRKMQEGSPAQNNLKDAVVHNNDEQDYEFDSNNSSSDDWFRPLDPRNPVCNFLIEYYGLKGHQGVKRLARWSPSPNLLLLLPPSDNTKMTLLLTSLQELEESSKAAAPKKSGSRGSKYRSSSSHHHHYSANTGVFLEDVTMDDFATLLHLRGAILQDNGALYSPSQWFDVKQQRPQTSLVVAKDGGVFQKRHPASPYLWFRSILQQTLQAEPVLHCHGLHEWAMQYCPLGSPPPPSAKYQQHLALRVSQDVINQTVERKGISCTHVDALRFFAPAAGPLNHHGASLQRTDQLRLEQPACVHAHMDLLKIGLRLQPFSDAALMRRILQLSMDARRLDVAASPYDATAYGVGIVPIETKDGRAQYRKEQRELMDRAEPIRRELLDAYNLFLRLAFDEDPVVLESQLTPTAERYATAQPGSRPWRQNLMATSPSIIKTSIQE